MDSIRIHLGPMPPMLREMIDGLLTGESDMTVVGNSYGTEESLLAASSAGADVLIAQESSLNSGCVGAVLTGNPSAILTISAGGDGGTSVKLIRDSVSLTGTGSSPLADTVREILTRHSRFRPGDDDMNELN